MNNRFRALGLGLALAVLAVLVCIPGGLALWLHEPKPATVMELKQPFTPPSSLRDWVGRWTPRGPGWTWAWRFEDLVFGQRAVVTLTTRFIKLPDSTSGNTSEFGLGPAQFSNPKGVRVWLLSASQLRSLRDLLMQKGMELINAPRMTTADGITASLFTGQTIAIDGCTNQVGEEAAYFVRVRPDRTDLFASAQSTEVVTNHDGLSEGVPPSIGIQTNLDVALRMQIPKSNGVFIIAAPVGPGNGKSFGLIIDPP